MRTQRRFLSKFGPIGAVVTLSLLAASCVVVTGPVAPSTGISLTSGFDLAQVGYQRSEFFLGGCCRELRADRAADERREVERRARSHSATDGVYKTRMVVFRPTDPARFNGTVVVEWLNVSAGADLPTDWIMAHNEFIRKGYAYVGVSRASRRRQQPEDRCRAYASLVHPGDSYSYDIFTRAGERVRDQAATVLGGLAPATHPRDGRVAVGEPSRYVHRRDPPARPRVRRLHGAQPQTRAARGSVRAHSLT